jgi:hypothetical protein
VQGQAAGAEAVDVIPYTHQDLVGQSGNPVPAQEAAQRLEMRLQQVRAQPHGQGPSAPGDPSPQRRRDLVGMSARISMDIEGLSGESLSLFWRLSQTSDAAALTGTWEKPTLACRLRPRTQTDSATVNVWIPLPQDPGPFVLDLLVTRDGDGAVVGSQRVKPVG